MIGLGSYKKYRTVSGQSKVVVIEQVSTAY